MKNEIMRLANQYAEITALFPTHDNNTFLSLCEKARAALLAEVEKWEAVLGQPVPLTEWQKMEAERDELRAELEQERTDYKSKCTELELVHEALEAAKKDAALGKAMRGNYDTAKKMGIDRIHWRVSEIDAAMEATK